jgi:hypothetical protein
MRTRAHISIVGVIAALLPACTPADPYGSMPPGAYGPYPRPYVRYSAPWGRPNPIGFVEVVEPPTLIVDEPIRSFRPKKEFVYDPAAPLGPEPPPPVLKREAELPIPDRTPLANLQIREPEASAPSVISAPKSASSYTGNWKARDARGISCRVQLSSTPALDLYKASVSNCPNTTLASVNAWSFGDNQVVLFSRGKVIARLSGAEAELRGKINETQDPLTLTR